MGAIYRIITTLAALIILFIAGSWIAHKYEVGPTLGLWGEQELTSVYNRYYEDDRDTDGIPATESGAVSIPVRAMFRRGTPWEPPEDMALVLPVFFGDDDFDHYNVFDGYTSDQYGQFSSSGGSCRDRLVNVLVIEKNFPAGRLVFDRRVLLPKVFYIGDGENQFVAALVVERDSNSDGKLDCGDDAVFQVVSLNDGAKEVVDRQFVPDNLVAIRFRLRDNEFVLSEVDPRAEEISIKSITISWDDLSVTEVVAPDLISNAQTAFDNVASD